jgi:hypothetical protein
MKMWPYNKVASLERDSLVVFYCLSASEIWPDIGVFFGVGGRGSL